MSFGGTRLLKLLSRDHPKMTTHRRKPIEVKLSELMMMMRMIGKYVYIILYCKIYRYFFAKRDEF
jgi:hypothetical protein